CKRGIISPQVIVSIGYRFGACCIPKLDVAGSNPVARSGNKAKAERELGVPVRVGHSAARNPCEARKSSAEGWKPHGPTISGPELPASQAERLSHRVLSDGFGRRRDVLLGKYGTAASRTEYARAIAEWEASGQRLPRSAAAKDLAVNELLVAYWRW